MRMIRSRKNVLLLGSILLSAVASADQVWEKPIAPGLVYRSEVRQDPPRVIHVLKFISSSPVISFSPELANGKVFSATGDGRGTVSKVVEDTQAIAGINADFFGLSGDPLGLMVKQNLLLSIPYPRRSVFAWGPNQSVFGYSTFFAAFVPDGSTRSVEINGVNEECTENKIVLNTPDAGISRVKRSPSFTAILRIDGNRLTTSTSIGATVVSTTSDGANMPLTGSTFTLVATGNKISSLTNLKPNQRIKLNISTTGFDWEKLENAIGGGPMLVRDGQRFIDSENQAFRDDVTQSRAPRTALGRTAEGDFIFVTVDGRQKSSVGATLEELSDLMRELGCRDAMNLDGGGSSFMNILGVGVSRPSDKNGERPVANTIAFFGPRIQPTGQTLRIVVTQGTGGKMTSAKVVDNKDREVPNIEVIWSMTGSAWIDQGGQITTIEPGNSEIKAYVRGVVISQKVSIK
jgi:hypothetical protein